MCLLSAAAGGGDATPIRLGGGAVIDSALNFVESGNNSEFLFEGNVSPDFGAGSFAAFRVSGDARGRITDTSR